MSIEMPVLTHYLVKRMLQEYIIHSLCLIWNQWMQMEYSLVPALLLSVTIFYSIDTK